MRKKNDSSHTGNGIEIKQMRCLYCCEGFSSARYSKYYNILVPASNVFVASYQYLNISKSKQRNYKCAKLLNHRFNRTFVNTFKHTDANRFVDIIKCRFYIVST